MLDHLQHLPVGALIPLILLAAAVGHGLSRACFWAAERLDHKRQLRRLEHYANHPAARARHSRKEKP